MLALADPFLQRDATSTRISRFPAFGRSRNAPPGMPSVALRWSPMSVGVGTVPNATLPNYLNLKSVTLIVPTSLSFSLIR